MEKRKLKTTIYHVQDILDRISTFDGLNYYGVRFNNKGFASCPFHNERTPSFHYDKKKDRYYCFSCNKGGTIIDFVADYFNYNLPSDLPKVLEKIDKDFNLGLGHSLSPEEKRAYAEEQKTNKRLIDSEKLFKDEIKQNYGKWSDIHRFLYKIYLSNDKSDDDLGEVLKLLDLALDDFSGHEVRGWPLKTLNDNQMLYIKQAEMLLDEEKMAFSYNEKSNYKKQSDADDKADMDIVHY